MKISQEFIDEIMMSHYAKGYNATEISKIYNIPYCRARKILLQNGAHLTRGRKRISPESAQIVEMWQNGVQSVDLLAERFGKSKNAIHIILHREGKKTLFYCDMRNEIISIIEKAQNGEKPVRGWQSRLAEKYGVTRQAVGDIVRKVKNNI